MRRQPFNKNSMMRFWLRDERGTQLVELAIMLPLVAVLFGTVAEFGRMFYTYNTLAKATRAAARYAVVQPPEDASKDTAAKKLAVYGNTAGDGAPVVEGLDVANISVNRSGELTTVTIQNFNYTPLFDLGKLIRNPDLSLNLPLAAKTTMRQIRK